MTMEPRQRKFEIPRKQFIPLVEKHICISCDGSGKCRACGGEGTGGDMYNDYKCYTCGGSGKCRFCGGDGEG